MLNDNQLGANQTTDKKKNKKKLQKFAENHCEACWEDKALSSMLKGKNTHPKQT